ncbi:glycosyltransferase family 4 protein [bacterium]|nr:glycosyltransferase family 4 protein [bacterium]
MTRTIHIMTATLTAGDAIGNYSRILQRIFWRQGYRVRLYADLWDEYSLCSHSQEFDQVCTPDDILWYHYSIYSENIQVIERHRVFTILDYHGVTPPDLFHGYSDHLEKLCIMGREKIGQLEDSVDLAVAHSDYTLKELQDYGFKSVVKVPLAVDTTRFAQSQHNGLAQLLRESEYLLFVGRITPQKSLLELIEAFAELARGHDGLYLLLVGEYSYSRAYVAELEQRIEARGLAGRVILTGKVKDIRALKALFQNALFSVYLSHWETFCVPIIESMYLGTPVIGLNKTAIPEVLGDGGILLDDHDPARFRQAVGPYLGNRARYDELCQKAEQHARCYTEASLETRLDELVLPRLARPAHRPRIACVVQRYGLEVAGGAEYLCRLLTEHLARYFEIEVLTTCAIDYHSWQNEYPPGLSWINDIPVHRFPVHEPRTMSRFTSMSRKLFEGGVQAISFNQAMDWMRLQGPRARDLIRHIQEHHADYDFFLFFTYLYATTFYGLPLVRDKSVLVPTAHNEPAIYLKPFAELFHQPRGLLYLTEAERDFVLRLYQNHHVPSVVTGIGIDQPANYEADRFRAKYKLDGPYLLYVGRIARSKGCQEFITTFLNYKRELGGPLKLVLMGKMLLEGEHSTHPDIIYTGYVPDQDKWDALAGAACFVNPSPFESLSFSVLEAWSLATPTLVNARCDVLVDHTRRSQGGLIYRTDVDFFQAIEALFSTPERLKAMGLRGQEYVQTNYTWDKVEGTILAFLAELHNPTLKPSFQS